jgi:hypothetical protein
MLGILRRARERRRRKGVEARSMVVVLWQLEVLHVVIDLILGHDEYGLNYGDTVAAITTIEGWRIDRRPAQIRSSLMTIKP